MDVEVGDTMPDGWQLWLDWHKVVAPDNQSEIEALEADQGKYLGYVRLVGRRQGSVKLADHIETVATQYTKMQHKDHALQAVGCGIDQPQDFLLTEHDRQLLRHLGENEIVVRELTPPQRTLVQEPQGRDPNLDGAGLKLLLLQ
jgi:hypothetical protein